MHITEVSATNLKGRTFTHQLTPCTILAGKNQSGKTAILDAIRFVISGRNPALDKTTAGTFELSSGSRMDAQILFLDTITTETVYARKAVLIDGSVKITPPKPYADLESPLLDPDTYWGLTDREQVDYIAARAKLPDSISAKGIIARLERISFGDEHSEQCEEAKIAAIQSIKRDMERYRDSVNDGIRAAVQSISDEFKTANASETQWEKASQGFAELRLREDECSADTLTDLRAESERLQGLIGVANQRLGEMQGRTKDAVKQAARRLELEGVIASEFEPAPVPVLSVKYDDSIKEIEETVAEWESDLAKLPPYSEMVIAARDEAGRILDRAFHDSGHYQNLLAKSQKDLDEVESMECCKFCQGKAKGWKNKILVPLTKARDESALDADKARQAHLEAKAAYDEAVSKADAMTAISAKRSEYIAAIKKGKDGLESVQGMKLNAQRDIAEAEKTNATQQALHASRQESARSELAAMESLQAPNEQELFKANRDVQELTELSNTNTAKLQSAQRLQQDLQRAAQSETEWNKAKTSRDVLKRIKEELLAIKAELVTAAFEPLLTTANRIMASVLGFDLAYDPEKGIGYWSPTGFVSHRTMSGTEKALTYIAIGAALASGSQLRLAMVDELYRLTGEKQGDAMDSLFWAVENGLLDQVLVVIPVDNMEDTAHYPKVSGYSVVWTGSEVAA